MIWVTVTSQLEFCSSFLAGLRESILGLVSQKECLQCKIFALIAQRMLMVVCFSLNKSQGPHLGFPSDFLFCVLLAVLPSLVPSCLGPWVRFPSTVVLSVLPEGPLLGGQSHTGSLSVWFWISAVLPSPAFPFLTDARPSDTRLTLWAACPVTLEQELHRGGACCLSSCFGIPDPVVSPDRWWFGGKCLSQE